MGFKKDWIETDAFKKIEEKYDVQLGRPCGEGWAPLIDRLIGDLIALGWDKHIGQVKEKFGGLRFYIGSGTSEIFDRIDKAEAESQITCENCGEPGHERGGGWIKTLCDNCDGTEVD